MPNDSAMKQYTTEELETIGKRGESQTDWTRVDAMTEDDLEAAIDHEEEGEFDWSDVEVGMPPAKQQATVRFDVDVVEWFKAQGQGYQMRMNAVLRRYVEAQKQR